MRLPLTLILVTCMSCGGASVVEFPRRVAPAGYPVRRREELPGRFMTIPKADIAKALAGQRYRVRWGILQLPGPDGPVDALTGAYGFRAEGPFEQEIEVVADDVQVSVFPGEVGPGPTHRLFGCVDIRPSHVHGITRPDVVVLDVQPIGDAPATPFVLDAVTGEKLPIDGSQVQDENKMPCELR